MRSSRAIAADPSPLSNNFLTRSRSRRALPSLRALALGHRDPSSWRRTSVSKAAKAASIPKNARPAAVEVSAFCSRTLRCGPAIDLVSDVGKIAQRAAKAVEARHDKHLAFAQDGEPLLQLRPALALCSASRLLEACVYTSAVQCLVLNGRVSTSDANDPSGYPVIVQSRGTVCAGALVAERAVKAVAMLVGKRRLNSRTRS